MSRKKTSATVDLEEVDSSGPAAAPGIQSVEIGMEVLAALSRFVVPQSLSDLARTCGMSRTKAYRYLASLARTGFVEREPGSGHYRLGGRAVQVGLAALANVDFVRIGSEWMPEICADLQEAVFLTVWGQQGATIVRWEEAGRPIAVNVRVGSIMPLIPSATGQVFGAYLPTAATRPFLLEELKRGEGESLGVRNLTDAAKLFAEVRRRQYGQAMGAVLPSIEAFARPVFGHSGKLVGTITTLGLKGQFKNSPTGTTATALAGWANRLSQRLGASEEVLS